MTANRPCLRAGLYTQIHTHTKMDWNTIITSLLGGLLTGGGLAGVVYFKENKRNKQLQNDILASTQWKELFEKEEAKNEKLNAKLDASYKENSLLRDKNNDLSTQNAVLKILKCEIIACEKREPPIKNANKLKQ